MWLSVVRSFQLLEGFKGNIFLGFLNSSNHAFCFWSGVLGVIAEVLEGIHMGFYYVLF